jgi:GT2 family glycosyltransferase
LAAAIAVVVVNYNSGSFLEECVASLQPALHDGVPVDIVVVDNASPIDQGPWLARASARGARVVRRDVNDGYGAGCNHGLAVTEAPLVFFLNADIRACPGALSALANHLAAHPRVGIAEPRCYIDDALHWLQPAFHPPSWNGLLASVASRFSVHLGRRRERAALRQQIAGWRTADAYGCQALSGAFLATRRGLMARVGGFDERYPLAYEDTDLFARVRAAGLELAIVPAARAVHYAHRSRVTVLAESLAKDAVGRRLYLREHLGRLAWWLDRIGRPARSGQRPCVDLGVTSGPVELRLDGDPGPFVLLLAYDPRFEVYAGHFGVGSTYSFPPAAWQSLLPVPIHVRAHRLADLALVGAWVFRRGPVGVG